MPELPTKESRLAGAQPSLEQRFDAISARLRLIQWMTAMIIGLLIVALMKLGCG